MDSLNEGIVLSSTTDQKVESPALQRVQIWEKTGMLKGVPDERKQDLANLFECQRYHHAGTDHLDPGFQRVIFGMLKRIFLDLESHQKYDIRCDFDITRCAVEDLGIEGFWYPTLGELYRRGDYNLEQEKIKVARLCVELRSRIDDFLHNLNLFSIFYFQGLTLHPENKRLHLYYHLG